VIHDKAVQAAHAAICEQNIDDCLDPEWRGKCVKAVEAAAPYQEIARAALESAAFLAAQALEDAAEAIDADPYDDLDPFYAGWLRDRARKIREEA